MTSRNRRRLAASGVALIGAAAGAVGLGAGLLVPAMAQAAPAAHAAKPPVNLIKDAGAEQAKPDSDGGVVKVPDWTPAKGSQFTATAYGASGGFPDKTTPGPKERGKAFFAGGPSGNTSGATQSESLKADASLIKAGKAAFTLSAWLGGWSDQGDHCSFTVTWKNAAGQALSHTTVGPVTEAQRKGVTKFLLRTAHGTVPKTAVTALLTLRMVREDGSYIDGYADNLSLTITRKS
jgi:hypothetical protein